MSSILKNQAPKQSEIEDFLNNIFFLLPKGFIEFYSETNGADISSDVLYTVLWPLTSMLQLNKDYDVEAYAPQFFIFGSDGGDMAFVIEKSTGKIFEAPFIGMSKDEVMFRANTFDEFINSR